MVRGIVKLSILIAVSILGLALPAAAQDRTILVFDGSGSMWGQIDGKSKIEIARETLSGVLADLPDNMDLGLMAYGHRREGDCGDIELIVPAEPSATSGTKISEAVGRINPKGKTPLSDAVRQAAEAINYRDEKATVILITDGLETCNADPCALGKELEANGTEFTAHIVGFGLTEEEGAQVACLAENTGGLYLQARDAGGLVDALTETVAVAAAPPPPPEPEPAPEPEKPEFNLIATPILTEGARPLTNKDDIRWDIFRANPDGSRGDNVQTAYDTVLKRYLDAGSYLLAIRLGLVKLETPIEVVGNETSEVIVDLNAGTMNLTGLPAEGAEPAKEVRWDVTVPGSSEASTNYGGQTRWIVPAGVQAVKGIIGRAIAEVEIEVPAGEVVDVDVIIAVGRVRPHGLYAADGPVVESDIRFDVLATKADITGKRANIGTNYGDGAAFDIPPGDYIVSARVGAATAEVPFTVGANELVEPNVVLNAGVLAITAPGGDRIDILSGKPDLTGKRKSVIGNYGEAFQATIGEGSYLVKVRKKDKSEAESEVEVTAGQRTEVTVE